ncbi:MAG: hypothetical protein ACKODH_17640, partial [Limisphaerales bacterium]
MSEQVQQVAMKAMLAILCACALPAAGQTNTNAVTFRTLTRTVETVYVSRLQTAYVDFAYRDGGVRQWGTEVVDVRPAMPAFYNGRKQVDGFYFLAGKVISVLEDGVLLMLDENVGHEREPVFLFRPPAQ